MMLLDILSYLHDDILVKVDRAAMSKGLETRIPLLDPSIINFSWTLPYHYKVREGESKWILKKILEKHIPIKMIYRPKMGFSIPIDEWLKKDLKEWSESLIYIDNNDKIEHFDYSMIRSMWGEHLSGRRNWGYSLWNILTFFSWKQFQKV